MFSSFAAQIGPTTMVSDQTVLKGFGFQIYILTVQSNQPTDARKYCQINLNLKYPQGFQFSVLSTTFRGYTALDAGVNATLSALYYFSGRKSMTNHFICILIFVHFSEPGPGQDINRVPRTRYNGL